MFRIGERVKSIVDVPAVTGVVTRKNGEYIYVEQDITEIEFEFYDCELAKI